MQTFYKNLYIILFIGGLCALYTHPTYANNPSVSASVDKDKVQLNQYLSYLITVESQDSVNISEPRLPAVEGLEFFSRSQSSQFFTSLMNGTMQSTRRQVLTYRFKVTKIGQLTIPSTEVYIDNTPYKTNPVTITVQEEPITQQPQNKRRSLFDFDEGDDLFSQFFGTPRNTTPNEDLTDAFFIQVETDKKEVYVGEQIMVSWYLYTKHHIADINTLKYPLLQGFWKEDIHTANRLAFTQEIHEGVIYKKALLARYALFPINAGRSYIDSYEVQCEVVPAFGFNRFSFSRGKTYQNKSNEIAIQIKPLPIENQPEGFSGAVGQYNLILQKPKTTEMKVNEPFSYTLKFEGKGNAKRIQLPKFNLPEGLESYDTKTTSKYLQNGHGYKEFEMLLIPRKPGELSIPPIRFSYFDPQQETYIQKEIPSWQINVSPSLTSTKTSHTFKQEIKTTNIEDILNQPEVVISMPWLSPETKKILWIIIYIGLFLILTVKALWSFGLMNKKQQQVTFEERWKVIYELESQKQFRQLGRSVLQLVSDRLTQISTKKDVTIEELLANTPLRIQKKLKEPLTELLIHFETLAFASEDVVEQIDQQQIHKDLNKLKQVLFH